MIQKSVALVILKKDKILAVQRPADDDLLPDYWGLPAGTLRDKESFEEAALRVSREKLGVKVEILKLISEGRIKREKSTLYMKEYEVKIVERKPSVPQKILGVTQYQNLKWSSPEILIKAAQNGSLCSKLYLESINLNY